MYAHMYMYRFGGTSAHARICRMRRSNRGCWWKGGGGMGMGMYYVQGGGGYGYGHVLCTSGGRGILKK